MFLKSMLKSVLLTLLEYVTNVSKAFVLALRIHRAYDNPQDDQLSILLLA